VRLRGASGNDADDLFFGLLIVCVDYQQNRAGTNGPHRDPALLNLARVVPVRNRVGVVENKDRRFKANIVFATVSAILMIIPFKSHRAPRRFQNKGYGK
jgi:hypothetical protein